MDNIKVTEDRLSVEECSTVVTSETCGAISMFVGTTRNNFNGKKVLRLEYEGYVPMAEKEMRKICTIMRDKWSSIERIAMHHRLGLVPVCEASVIIAVCSPHRLASLQAVQYAIDTLKATVPIWKKEVYDEGEAEWKQNKECTWTSD